jgi:hypothetical protein
MLTFFSEQSHSHLFIIVFPKAKAFGIPASSLFFSSQCFRLLLLFAHTNFVGYCQSGMQSSKFPVHETLKKLCVRQAAGKLWWNRGMNSFPLPASWAEVGACDLKRLRMVAYTQDGHTSALQAVQEVCFIVTNIKRPFFFSVWRPWNVWAHRIVIPQSTTIIPSLVPTGYVFVSEESLIFADSRARPRVYDDACDQTHEN